VVGKNAVREFKSAAWKSKQGAKRYAKSVNKEVTLSDVDLRTQLALIGEYLPKGSSVLDVGAGTGALALPLAREGYIVTATDISDEMLKKLKGFDREDRIKVLVADLFDQNALTSTGPFGGAVSRWFLPHFVEWGRIVSAVAACLSPGGIFVFDMPSRAHVEKASALGEITPEQFGYDHGENASSVNPFYFYQAQTDDEVRNVLSGAGMEFVDRVPYGLFKSNMLIALAVGPEKWIELSNVVNRSVKMEDGLAEIIFGLEASITRYLPAEMVHGSFVVARKP